MNLQTNTSHLKLIEFTFTSDWTYVNVKVESIKTAY